MKKSSKIFLGILLALILGSPAYSFDPFGDILKGLEPPPKETSKESATQKDNTQQSTSKKSSKGGVLGILQGAGQLIQALQPIGYREERAIGGSLALEVFSRFGGHYHDPRLENYITLVGNAVVSVSDRAEIPYHFAILNTEQPNAFAAPGGYVFVSIGLMRMLKNEAELAGVLGHEIAHITNRHALKTLERSKTLQGISNLTTSVMGENPAMFNKIIGEMTETLFTKGLDKEMEYDADLTGTEYAYRAGYYPAGLKDFLKMLGAKTSSRSSVFFSTHPSPGARNARLARVMNSYKEAALAPVLTRRYLTKTKGRL